MGDILNVEPSLMHCKTHILETDVLGTAFPSRLIAACMQNAQEILVLVVNSLVGTMSLVTDLLKQSSEIS